MNGAEVQRHFKYFGMGKMLNMVKMVNETVR